MFFFFDRRAPTLAPWLLADFSSSTTLNPVPLDTPRSSTVCRVAAETSTRKPGPLERGGTLEGDKAAGKDAGAAARPRGQVRGGDARGERGQRGLVRPPVGQRHVGPPQFKKADGETDWDAVIDAEVVHRKALEDCPAVYDEDGLFDTSIVPWWVWVKRFHLPEAEKINGRAAMVGYAFAYVIDAAGGAGLVDLHQSFLGKATIFLTVAFCLTVRRLEDLDTLEVTMRPPSTTSSGTPPGRARKALGQQLNEKQQEG